ncbi:inactive leucine-rich repeat receptor-like protein kinase CORYNE isoform X2 [Selaginella moellendorffii]|nr:inactive leucine-rich repeat receptor-like protein kinase CORYNE isoform X1 [Selaginella moellendorffii]XP_024532974.1 inactive leucine-rich repeat receptor-like protein kinase CORYNE isoform X2 [Selaginella moellendorffii]|eukprot:XP_024532973.1 inactive leucine-rich repeat receptor-like protein kinase CORYNE isoform X1 [Selaginella moellendorffii]
MAGFLALILSSLWVLLLLGGCHGEELEFATSVDTSDIAALRSFAAHIRHDPSGALRSWRRDEEACTAWSGVECSWIHGSQGFRVVSIRLPKSLLEGELSPRLGLLSELRVLDLSANRLSGLIPDEIAQLPKLRSIDLSSNRLVGRIPTGNGNGNSLRSAAAFAGNPGLCGWPLDRECPPSSIITTKKHYSSARRALLQDGATAPSPSQSPTPPSSNGSEAPSPSAAAAGSSPRHKGRSRARRWGIGAALGVIAGSVSGVLVGIIARAGIIVYKRARAKNGPIIFFHKLTPKMLAFLDSPESFQQMPLLGAGGAGKVYKAVLEGGMEVAVKRIPIQPPEPPSSSDASRSSGKGSFGKRHTVAEMETLGKIRHVNLAWLYAYILKPDAHLLLYQYMPRGSLQDVLARVRDGAMELEWSARQRIATGMVRGLKYLHYDCSPKILHRDLKTSNILLDEELEAHLGDFGLAKALPDGMTHVTTQVAGTIGYIAPEYHQTCKFTVSSDVYSMGIVLGVLISGREPTDEFFKDFPGGIVPWMCYLVQSGQELRGIDPTLLKPAARGGGEGGGDDTLGQTPGFANLDEITEMKRAMRIACLCTKLNPQDRPSTKDVLVMLNPGKLENVRPMEELLRDG